MVATSQPAQAQSFNGTGTINGAASVTVGGTTVGGNGAATVTGSGTITRNGSGGVTGQVQGSATLNANCNGCGRASPYNIGGVINAQGSGSVVIPGKGVLTGSGSLVGAGAGTVSPGGAVTATGTGTLTLNGTLTGSPLAIDPTATVVKGVVLPQVQTAVEFARERMFDVRDRAGAPAGNGNLGYAPNAPSAILEQTSAAFGALDPTQFGALGYSALPTHKAPPPAAPSVVFATWGSGTFDYERVTGVYQGIDISSVTRAGGGIAGADWTVPMASGAHFLGGILAGDTAMSINQPNGSNTTVQAPTIGAYAAYLMGGFSVDGLYTSTWINANSTFVGGTLQQNAQSNNFAANIQYRIPLQNAWWFEPTAGATYTYTFQSPAFGNEDVLRLQAGARLGTSGKWGSVIVEPTLTGLVYSDVIANGNGGLQGFTPVAADRGQIWGKGVVKLNFVLSPNFSAYVQNEVHGTRGTENAFGYVGTVGLRWTF